MSIINDALKKTQLSFKKKDKPLEKKPEPQTSQSTSNVYEKFYKTQNDLKKTAAAGSLLKQKPSNKKIPTGLRSAKKWVQVSAAVTALLLFAYVGFFFLLHYTPVKNLAHSFQKNNGTKTRIIRRAQKRRKYKPGELVLNGTSLIDGKRVALVNNEIYQTGETINGKKITSINLNKIELRDNEKIITLKVH